MRCKKCGLEKAYICGMCCAAACDNLTARLDAQLKDAEAVIVPLVEYIQGGYNCSPAEQWYKVANALNHYAVLYCWDKVVESAKYEKERT